MNLKLYRGFVLLFMMLWVVLMSSCTRSLTTEEMFLKGQRVIGELKSYTTIATYRVVEGGETREYKFKQWVEMPDKYKIQIIAPESLSGKTVVSDGRELKITHPQMNDSLSFEVDVTNQQGPLFIGDFLQDYWLSEEVAKRVHEEKGRQYLVYECPGLAQSSKQTKQELWMDADEWVPVKIVTYDYNGEISSMVIFEDFQCDWTVPLNFFSPQNVLPDQTGMCGRVIDGVG